MSTKFVPKDPITNTPLSGPMMNQSTASYMDLGELIGFEMDPACKMLQSPIDQAVHGSI